MTLIYKEVEVEVDLDDFSDDELLEEIERRNISLDSGDPEYTKEVVYRMWEKYRLNQDIGEELREFFWQSIGRNV